MSIMAPTIYVTRVQAGNDPELADKPDDFQVTLGCSKCGGDGRHYAYWVDGGRCWECGGTGGHYKVDLKTCRKAAKAANRREELRREKYEREVTAYRERHEAWVAANAADWELVCRFTHTSAMALELAGSWNIPTENQLRVFREMAAREDAEAERKASGVAVPEGRYLVTGKVVSVREERNNFSYTESYILKAVVENEDGWRVWVTVPSSAAHPDRGDLVSFTATVERSKDDQLFGFAKRPTKWSNPSLDARLAEEENPDA